MVPGKKKKKKTFQPAANHSGILLIEPLHQAFIYTRGSRLDPPRPVY